MTARAESGAECSLQSSQNLQEAVRHPLTAEVLAEQFGRLGGTAYESRRVDARIEGRPMAPLSVFGQLRRELIERLDASVVRRPPLPVAAKSPLAAMRGAIRGGCRVSPEENAAVPASESPSPRWIALCRRVEQVRPAVVAGAAEIIVDLPDADQCTEAIAQAHAAGAAVLLAAPRMQKPGEMEAFESCCVLGPTGCWPATWLRSRYVPSGACRLSPISPSTPQTN